MPAELVVRQAGFAPVKGMRHLALDAVDLDEQGAVGDRSYCLVDVDAARVLRTVQHPALIGVVAQVDEDVLGLTLPTGASVVARADQHGRTITCDYWGRPVPAFGKRRDAPVGNRDNDDAPWVAAGKLDCGLE